MIGQPSPASAHLDQLSSSRHQLSAARRQLSSSRRLNLPQPDGGAANVFARSGDLSAAQRVQAPSRSPESDIAQGALSQIGRGQSSRGSQLERPVEVLHSGNMLAIYIEGGGLSNRRFDQVADQSDNAKTVMIENVKIAFEQIRESTNKLIKNSNEWMEMLDKAYKNVVGCFLQDLPFDREKLERLGMLVEFTRQLIKTQAENSDMIRSAAAVDLAQYIGKTEAEINVIREGLHAEIKVVQFALEVIYENENHQITLETAKQEIMKKMTDQSHAQDQAIQERVAREEQEEFQRVQQRKQQKHAQALDLKRLDLDEIKEENNHEYRKREIDLENDYKNKKLAADALNKVIDKVPPPPRCILM